MTSGGSGEGEALLPSTEEAPNDCSKQHRPKSLSTGAIYLHRWYGSGGGGGGGGGPTTVHEHDKHKDNNKLADAVAPQGEAPTCQHQLTNNDPPLPPAPPPTPQQERQRDEEAQPKGSGRGGRGRGKGRRNSRRSSGRRSSGSSKPSSTKGTSSSSTSTTSLTASSMPSSSSSARRLVAAAPRSATAVAAAGSSKQVPLPLQRPLDDAARRRGLMGVVAVLLVASAMVLAIDSKNHTVVEGQRDRQRRREEPVIHIAFVGDAQDYYRENPQLLLDDDSVESDVSCLQMDASLLSVVGLSGAAATSSRNENANETGAKEADANVIATTEQDNHNETQSEKDTRSDIDSAFAMSVSRRDRENHHHHNSNNNTAAGVPLRSSTSPSIRSARTRPQRTVQDLLAPSRDDSAVVVDYLVLTDAVSHVVDPALRQATLTVLQQVYAPLLWASRPDREQPTTVILLMTPGEPVDAIQEGYETYATALRQAHVRRVRIAPVALAFERVREMYHDELWPKLHRDGELSRHGSFLQKCVLHWTVFGYGPPSQTSLSSSSSLTSAFPKKGLLRGRNKKKKKEEDKDNDTPPEDKPTEQEETLLRYVAKVVYCSYHEGGRLPLLKETTKYCSLDS